jgi:capsular polysaccharide transport system permease protein
MSGESRAGPGRAAITTRHGTAPQLEGDSQILPDVAPAHQARPVQAASRRSAALAKGLSDAKVVIGKLLRDARFARRKTIVALPRLKDHPVLSSFIGLVLLPSFVATFYLAFIASDQLAAEARFAVRQNEMDSRSSSEHDTGASGSTSNTNIGFSFTATGQDAYVVTSYIGSRAIVDDLGQKLNLQEIFRRPEADFWSRLKRNATIEELTEYWQSMVSTYIDGPSGIVTLRVRAFRADDAVVVARAVLELSETLVNRISDRARRDAMSKAEEEVRRSYEMTRAALAGLRNFRDSTGIIDPVQTGTETAKLLLPLLAQKIQLENDLFVASRDLDDSAPTIKVLKNRLQTTEQQIATLKATLTSPTAGSQTLTASLGKFEELELQRQFTEKLYALAETDLDRARERAARQSVYLTVFVPPSLPEESRYPRRFAFSVLTFVALTILWGIGCMMIASVEDHRL